MAVSVETRLIVIQRAGYLCEKCLGPLGTLEGMSVHHRRPRGMGGTKRPGINEAENLLALCGSGTTGCHGRIEANRAESYSRGLLLRTGANAHTTPYLDDRGDWWLLVGGTKYRIDMPDRP